MIESIFSWLNDQLLKMKWLEDGVGYVFKEIFRLDSESLLYKSLTFFFYDVIKIFILLSVLIFIASYIQSFFTPEKTRRILGRFKGIWANIIGALLGTLTPFCSCSSIPIFIGFTKAGLPLGVTFSFLISSPLVDLASVLLLATLFGWEVALLYVGAGLVIAVIGGTLISVFKMESHIEPFILEGGILKTTDDIKDLETTLSFKDRIKYAFLEVKLIIKKVWIYVLIGVGIGAIIHGYMPQSFIESVLGSKNPFSVVIATLIGAPMYADIFGTLPIAEALALKGVGIGTILAFMMSVTALSLPSIIMLKKVVKPKLLSMFIGVVLVGILIMGYVFNAIEYLI